MSKLINPTMREIHELYEKFERLSKKGDEDYFQINQLHEEGHELFVSSVSDFTPEEMINGFKYGTELLQRNISGAMIREEYYHPDYFEVIVQSVKEDKFVSNYKFIFWLQKRLRREDLVEILRISIHSHDYKVQVNSLSVVREEVLVELIPDVEKLCNLPDINPEEVFVPDYFTFDSNLYIDHIKRNRTSIRDDAIKTLQLLKENRKE